MKKHKVIFRIPLIVICCMCFTVTGYARAGGGGSSGGSGEDLEAVRAVGRIVIITGKAEDAEDRLK